LGQRKTFPTGVEYHQDLAENHDVSEQSGAKSGAIPPDLQKVIEAWPSLHHHKRAAIVRMLSR